MLIHPGEPSPSTGESTLGNKIARQQIPSMQSRQRPSEHNSKPSVADFLCYSTANPHARGKPAVPLSEATVQVIDTEGLRANLLESHTFSLLLGAA